MTNCTIALNLLNLKKEYQVSLNSVKNLITHKKNFSFCQPCFSPVWDTGLNGISLLESGLSLKNLPIQKACKWLEKKQSVSKVYYPGLPSNPQYDLAMKQQSTGGGIVSFKINGNKK